MLLGLELKGFPTMILERNTKFLFSFNSKEEILATADEDIWNNSRASGIKPHSISSSLLHMLIKKRDKECNKTP